MLEKCMLCPRKCGVDRTAGEKGFCGAGAKVRIARAALHFWEEPCISGESGSGTVFFSGCTMRCVYCQNYEISANGMGYTVEIAELADIFAELEAQGANNINLVTPTQFVPQIIKATELARKRGMALPIVYNTGGYERVETLKMLDGYVDVYMPDLKYISEELSRAYSSAPAYGEIAKAALDEMLRQTGAPIFNENGIMERGMIIRHLMLPGSLNDSVKVINYVHRHFGSKVYFSLMSQYTPVRHMEKFDCLNERLNMEKYNAAVALCERLGMENVFIQEGEAAQESFIPEFSNVP